MSAATLPTLGAVTAIVVLLLAHRAAPRLTAPARVPVAVARTSARSWRSRSWRPQRAPRPPDDEAVAAWCERVAAGVRGGSSLTRAVLDAESHGGDPSPFPDLVHAIQRGRPLGDAFRQVPDGPATAVGLAAPVLATCAELGGPAAGSIERVAAVLLGRASERAERHAASAQARLSARVLTIVPLAVLVLLTLTEPSIRQTLGTPAGIACVVVGGALDLLGWWWMHRMIGAAT